MNRVKRLAAVILCAVTAAGIFTGCGDIDRDKYIAKSRSEAEGSSASEESQQESGRQNAPEELITSDGAWKSMKFTLDGNELVLIKLPYSSLTEQGWSFDYNVYGMKDLLTDSGVFYQRSVYLDHEGMDDGTICIGFANFNDEKSKVDDMHICSIEFTSKDKTQYPEVTLEGGITWGADEEAIKSAYGEPSASERNDDEKYTNLTYTDNAGKTIYLNIYDDGGLGKITMDSYG